MAGVVTHARRFASSRGLGTFAKHGALSLEFPSAPQPAEHLKSRVVFSTREIFEPLSRRHVDAIITSAHRVARLPLVVGSVSISTAFPLFIGKIRRKFISYYHLTLRTLLASVATRPVFA